MTTQAVLAEAVKLDDLRAGALALLMRARNEYHWWHSRYTYAQNLDEVRMCNRLYWAYCMAYWDLWAALESLWDDDTTVDNWLFGAAVEL